LKTKSLNIIIAILILGCSLSYSQQLSLTGRKHIPLNHKSFLLDDSTKKPVTLKNVSLGGIFLSLGTGLSVPLRNFNINSNYAFGIFGRLEYSSTKIYPLVFGGEVSYFSYSGNDDFKTINILKAFTTRILGYGLTIEYSLSRLLHTSYSMPFITIDIKNNTIKREYDDAVTFTDLPRQESRISFGAGVGFTLFVLDFYVKYNFMKDMSNFGVFAKLKFPIIRM
jgi:hypothetical protein